MLQLLRLPRLWFGFRQPVGRFDYAASGLLLFAVKIALDSVLYYSATGRAWSPLSYMDPRYSLRFDRVPLSEQWVIWVLAVAMLPFLWIGVSMTVRRCLDAGLPPIWSLLFFVPAVNYLMMVLLCFLPTRGAADAGDLPAGGKVRFSDAPGLWVRGLAAGAGTGLMMILLSVLVLDRYGQALFLGAPFVMGYLPAFMLNRTGRVGAAATIGIAQLALLVAALAVMLFALEGIVCIAMAAPLAVMLAMLGALLGRGIAGLVRAVTGGAGSMALALPLLLATEAGEASPPLREVMTSVEIDAPAVEIWSHVIAFPDLPPPREWLFQMRIAYPVGASLEGASPGMIRTCRFSTGEFVEPITAWEPPWRLAFDVVAQPLPMRELTPYSHVFAPHLIDGMRSRRGEFRLVPLADDRTRLEGRTWYTLDLWPQAYWSVWSDFVVHRIHRRVLEHVAALSTADP
jgi:uncharacterized membrane protein YhaH (DUF805 family)